MDFLTAFKNARIVDLSKVCYPGKEQRRLEIRSYQVYAGEIMNDIDTMSHIGTHVEAPCHYVTPLRGVKAKDIADYPPDAWMGEAIFVDLSVLGPKEAVTPEFLEKLGVRKGDIVIMGNSKQTGEDMNYLSARAAKWLADTEIKLLGLDTTFKIEEFFQPLEAMATHNYLMSKDIPLIEVMVNLDQLRERRFFFIGLPVAIVGLDAFPIRAIALEGVL
ncbi:MAG: cyclase family protein [Firmicutes bacterium]|jgi:kynurenine formamidase|nr:cyclase family protein [Bacillota bacterium]